MGGFGALKLTSKQSSQLESLGIFSLDELLFYFPYRYETIQEDDLPSALIDQKVCFSGKIVSEVAVFFHGKTKRCTFKVEVQGLVYHATIFNRLWIKKAVGRTLTFFGIKQAGSHLLINNFNSQPLADQIGIHAIYHQNKQINNRQITSLVAKALKQPLSDNLPSSLIAKYKLLDLTTSLVTIHQPSGEELLQQAINRLKYHELFFYNLQLLYQKQHFKVLKRPKEFDQARIDDFIKKLPYELKMSQKQAVREILDDLRQNTTMMRLLQGEVGSGKTIVAFIAMLACSLADYQAVLLAPTDILARQHYENMRRFFPEAEIALLSSSLDSQNSQRALEAIAAKRVKLICGTHRVFQADVEYPALGLVIADEQQRFGVLQRQKLLEKAEQVDFLQMSATPIPRTIALYLYADLDVSVLTESVYPRGNIKTEFIAQNGFFPIRHKIEEVLDAGNSAYLVVSRIEESQDEERYVAALLAKLQHYYKGRYRLAAIHGKMKARENTEVMADFQAGKIDILICTSIIEVGLDVPRANLMIIYNAERFGLSQLHQLRGRIGRHGMTGYCYLLSDTDDEKALDRLKYFASHQDGQEIALYDFHSRGYGDIAGVRQSGKQFFSLVDITKDLVLVQKSYQDAKDYLQQAKIDDSLLSNLGNDSIIRN